MSEGYPTEEDFKKWEEEEIDEYGQILKKKVSEGNGEFSEIIPIDSDGNLRAEDQKGKPLSLFGTLVSAESSSPHIFVAGRGAGGTEALYQAAAKVQTRFPELQFNFDKDPAGQWIKYTVHTSVSASPPIQP